MVNCQPVGEILPAECESVCVCACAHAGHGLYAQIYEMQCRHCVLSSTSLTPCRLLVRRLHSVVTFAWLMKSLGFLSPRTPSKHKWFGGNSKALAVSMYNNSDHGFQKIKYKVKRYFPLTLFVIGRASNPWTKIFRVL